MENQWPALVVTSGSQTGLCYTVQGAQASVGRGDDADFRLDSDSVSRRHATVVPAGDRLVVSDLGSANGTFVNGSRVVGTVVVNAGDTIRMADVELRFMMLGSASSPAAPSEPTYDVSRVSGNVSLGGGHQNTGSGHQNIGGYQNTGSGSQYVAGGDIHHGDKFELELDDPMQEMISGKGFGRVLMVIGLIVVVVGFGIWMSVIFSGFTQDSGGGFNEDGTLKELENPFDKEYLGINAPVLGFTMFGCGGLAYAMGFGMSKAARKRAEGRSR
jgi:hypothetical protein